MSINQLEPQQLVGFKKDKNLDLYRLRQVKRKAVHFKRLQIFGFSAETLRNGSENLSSAELRQLERFHSTLKTEHVRKTPYFSYEDAKEKMAQWIDFYNNGRLHGALLYLTPADYFEGRKESRLAERREKLHTADINRKAYRLQQQQA